MHYVSRHSEKRGRHGAAVYEATRVEDINTKLAQFKRHWRPGTTVLPALPIVTQNTKNQRGGGMEETLEAHSGARRLKSGELPIRPRRNV